MKYQALIASACLGFSCCSSTGVVYPRYVIDPPHDALYAHDVKDDLSLSKTCTPDKEKAKCIALLIEVFGAMEQELKELRKKVEELERGPKPLP